MWVVLQGKNLILWKKHVNCPFSLIVSLHATFMDNYLLSVSKSVETSAELSQHSQRRAFMTRRISTGADLADLAPNWSETMGEARVSAAAQSKLTRE